MVEIEIYWRNFMETFIKLYEIETLDGRYSYKRLPLITLYALFRILNQAHTCESVSFVRAIIFLTVSLYRIIFLTYIAFKIWF